MKEKEHKEPEIIEVEVVPDRYEFHTDSHWVSVDNEYWDVNKRIQITFVTPNSKDVVIEIGLDEAIKLSKELKYACKLVELVGD